MSVLQTVIMGLFAALQSNPTLNLLGKLYFCFFREFLSETHIIFLWNKFQFVNYRPLYFTIHSKMWPETGGNEILDRGLDAYVMKIESTAVEMFCIA